MKKRVSELITIEDIKKWNIENIVTIKAGTGAGKSYFIKNILYAFAKANNKKILFLVHRSNCINQFKEEIRVDKKSDIIDIKTYQSLESLKLKHKRNFDFSKYAYVVCDEFHYFMSDAAYNKTTDISLNMILNIDTSIKIFMSATGDYMKAYINNIKKLETIDYELPIDYDFIKQLTFFNKDETMEKFIEEAIEKKQKGIFFIQSATKAYELHKKYKKHTLFNCSKSNDKHYKYVDKDKINSMLKNEKFEERILITTTCLDAGVNIIDLDLKHVVCDVKDLGVLIQCIGRKRIQNVDDKIYLYIKIINNNQLGGMKRQLSEKIKKADYLRKHTVAEYLEEFPRQNDYNNIVYADTVEEQNKSTHKVNELMYFKCMVDGANIDTMLEYKKFGHCKFLADKFGFSDYRLINEDYAKDTIINYLDNLVGKKLYKEEQKELINKINLRFDGRQLKTPSSFNPIFKVEGIPYIITVPKRKSYRDKNGKVKKEKTYWIVGKISYQNVDRN